MRDDAPGEACFPELAHALAASTRCLATEDNLAAALDEARRAYQEASDDKREQARRLYRDALRRFTHLVLYGRVPAAI